MEHIYKSQGSAENFATNIESGTLTSGLSDKRLGLYGYTIETINMLLVPMITNK